jgi:thiamine transport system permease protein
MVAATFGIAALLGRRARAVAGVKAPRLAPHLQGGRDRALVVSALAPAALLLSVPLVTLVLRALSTPQGFGLGNFRTLFSTPRLAGSASSAGSALATSLVTAVIVAVIATSLALALATLIAARPRLGWLHGVVLLPLGVSSVVVGLGVLLTLARPALELSSTIGPRLLIPAAHVVIGLPIAVSVVLPAMRGIDARLIAAGASLGAGPGRVWRTIQWPLARRSALMAAGLCAAVSLGEFGASAFLARPGVQTLPTLMFRLLGRPGPENVGMAFAAAVVLALATAALALAADPSRRAVRIEA